MLWTNFTITLILMLSILILPYGLAKAQSSALSEQQARMAGARILKGDPYGQTVEEAQKRIQGAQLVVSGTFSCGKITKPLWHLRVVEPEKVISAGNPKIDGSLFVDARTGKIVCTGLPFLD